MLLLTAIRYFSIQVGLRQKTIIDPTMIDCMAKFANHAVDGNLSMKIEDGQAILRAKKNISSRSHLFWDYGIRDNDLPWTYNTMVIALFYSLLTKCNDICRWCCNSTQILFKLWSRCQTIMSSGHPYSNNDIDYHSSAKEFNQKEIHIFMLQKKLFCFCHGYIINHMNTI